MSSSVNDMEYNPIMARQRLIMQRVLSKLVPAMLEAGELEELEDGRLIVGKNFKNAKLPSRRSFNIP
ncbi:hypothetical protein [Pantoea sp. B65]|uniref:hypothetical protein n=1 Tax=Pantoea sp. B65 TaxID=2813359 RepID=UPI0039B4C303